MVTKLFKDCKQISKDTALKKSSFYTSTPIYPSVLITTLQYDPPKPGAHPSQIKDGSLRKGPITLTHP